MQKRLADGERLVGKKIGLTSKVVQDMLGVHQPDFGFLTDTSFLSVDVVVELPLYGRAQGVEFSDTFDIDLSDLDRVTNADFKLVADNGFPMDIEMQIYFYDNAGDEIIQSTATNGTRNG